MDAEFRAWSQKQDAATAAMRNGIERQADHLLLLIREVANISMLLAPKGSEGPSTLEQLLAQLVAQGQETIGLMRAMVEQGNRIETALAELTSAVPSLANGRNPAARQ